MSTSILPCTRPPVTNESTRAAKNGAQMSSSTSPAVSVTPVWTCFSSSEMSRPKPVATISGPLRLSGRRCHATRPNAAKDPPTRRYTTSAPATGASPAKRIGTSAPNAAAIARAHIKIQNSALRCGPLKRRGTSRARSASAVDARPLAMTDLGGQRLLTPWLLAGPGSGCPGLTAHSNRILAPSRPRRLITAAGGSDDGLSWTVETVSNAGAHLIGAATYAVWAPTGPAPPDRRTDRDRSAHPPGARARQPCASDGLTPFRRPDRRDRSEGPARVRLRPGS